MATYRALQQTWLSHESRMVEDGAVFQATFPAGMRLGDNLELVEDDKPKRKRGDPDPVESDLT